MDEYCFKERNLGKEAPYSSKIVCGFMLIELLVALAIIIILAVMTVPSLRSTLMDARIKAAADIFTQQIQVARSEAVERQQNVYLVLTPGSNWCSAINANSSCTCSPTNTCSINFINYADYLGVSLLAPVGFSGGSIYFDSTRGLPNQAAQVSFQDNSKTITVSVNALGQISVCSTNVTGYPSC